MRPQALRYISSRRYCQGKIDTTFFARLWQSVNPLSANPTKWSNTLKQLVGNLGLRDFLKSLKYFSGSTKKS